MGAKVCEESLQEFHVCPSLRHTNLFFFQRCGTALVSPVGNKLGALEIGGHPALGAQKTAPVFLWRVNGQAVDASTSGLGYSAALKPALAAVVNISSSKIVKTPSDGSPFAPFFNGPFFRQFFGDQFFHGSQMP